MDGLAPGGVPVIMKEGYGADPGLPRGSGARAERCRKDTRRGPRNQKRPHHTTPVVDRLQRRFQVTHPFHPRSGESFRLHDGPCKGDLVWR